MRRLFAKTLLEKALKDKDVYLLTGDLGYGMWDAYQEVLSTRYINCGAAEQAMMDIAVGLSLSGKVPVVYSITPFLLYRTYETLRTYIAHENLHVVLAGSGRDGDYEVDGFSHDATDAPGALAALGIDGRFPEEREEIPMITAELLNNPGPSFISLRR